MNYILPILFVFCAGVCQGQNDDANLQSVRLDMLSAFPLGPKTKQRRVKSKTVFTPEVWEENFKISKNLKISITPSISHYFVEVWDDNTKFRCASWLTPSNPNASLPAHYGGIIHEWICGEKSSVRVTDDKNRREPPLFQDGSLSSSRVIDMVSKELAFACGVLKLDQKNMVDLNLDATWKNARLNQLRDETEVLLDFDQVIDGQATNVKVSIVLVNCANGTANMKTLEFVFAKRSHAVLIDSILYDDNGFVSNFRVKVNGVNRYSTKCDVKAIEKSEIDTPPQFKFVRQPKFGFVHVKDRKMEVFKYENGQVSKVVDSSIKRIMPHRFSGNSGKQYEDTESIVFDDYLRKMSSMHCGIYSSAIVADAVGADFEISDLICEDYVSPKGSSVKHIRKLFGDMGLKTSVVQHGDVDFLRHLNKPVLLHFGKSYQVEGIAHWVACLGTNLDGSIRIVDAPRGEAALSCSDLMTQWDGLMIMPISSQDTGRFSLLLSRIRSLGQKLLLMLPAICAILILSRSDRSDLRFGVVVILATVLSSTIFWQYFDRSSFVNNPRSVLHCISKTPGLGQIVNTDLKVASLEDFEDGIVVDARTPQVYENGHWPGSINFPIDASLAETNEAIEKIGSAKKVVVYCQSTECKWADAIGYQLSFLGDFEVKVYRPGWNDLKVRTK